MIDCVPVHMYVLLSGYDIRDLMTISLMLFYFVNQAVQVKVFVDDLCKTGKLEGVKYTYWNECFTSKVTDSQVRCSSGRPYFLRIENSSFLE